MEALRILNGIDDRMTKSYILHEVTRAIAELDLKDAGQVAAALGVSKAAVYKHAAWNKIGYLIAPRARVYSPSDVEALRKSIFSFSYKGQRPATLTMIKGMRALREEGQTLVEIGKAFGKTESYVSKLLKKD